MMWYYRILPVVYLGDSQVWIHYVIKVSQYLGVFNKYSIQLHICNKPLPPLLNENNFQSETIHLNKASALKMCVAPAPRLVV